MPVTVSDESPLRLTTESHPFLSQIAKSCPSESIHLGSQPIDKTTKQATEPREQFDVVALGGTFDHLHAGHKILLTMAHI